MKKEKSCWTTGQLAIHLGVSRQWIRNQIKAGKIKCFPRLLSPEEGGREWYKISIKEVKRIEEELPLPRLGMPFRKFWDKYRALYDAVFEK